MYLFYGTFGKGETVSEIGLINKVGRGSHNIVHRGVTHGRPGTPLSIVVLDAQTERHAVSKSTSQKHLRTNVTPDFHVTYSKNGGNLGSESK